MPVCTWWASVVWLSSTCPLSKNNLVNFPWPPPPLAEQQTESIRDYHSFHFLPCIFTSSCPVLRSGRLLCLSVSFDDDNKAWWWQQWWWQEFNSRTMNGRLGIYICKKLPLFYSSASKPNFYFKWTIPPSPFEISPNSFPRAVSMLSHTQWQGNGV